MIGHCLGAAGAIETVATVLQLARGFVHPSVNSDDLHPEIADLIPAEKVPQTLIESNDIRIAAKASFGFGDVNSCLILKKWEE
jgi:3-oxoacyl-(acyl-carrier-protein) synthase